METGLEVHEVTIGELKRYAERMLTSAVRVVEENTEGGIAWVTKFNRVNVYGAATEWCAERGLQCVSVNQQPDGQDAIRISARKK